MAVEFLDLKPQYQQIRGEIDQAVQKVCESQQFILGPIVEDFENAFAQFCGVPYAVGVSSGTDALQLALKTAGVGPGDEVITTPFSFIATAEAISLLGAIPVFTDIDPKTFNLDPALIEEKITDKTKAILPVHLYGLCADMNPILEIAQKRNLKVIEDACQAVGAQYRGKPAGAMGDLGCFSLFPTKNLGGFGDGGVIVTRNEKVAEKLRMLRMHGSRERYIHEAVGMNARLDVIQAAVCRVKLKYLNQWNGRRREIAEYYKNHLKDLPLQLPEIPEGLQPVFHQFTIQTPLRDKLASFLKEKEIGTMTFYPLPIPFQICYDHLGYKKGDLPAAEKAAKEVLSLPVYPELTETQLKEVVEALEAFYVRVG